MVVSGGPPCQPFSLGGKHRGYMDERDMFPEAVRAVRELRPKAFIFENVKGLMRETFADYFEYIHLQLTHPGFTRRKGESWREHRVRLEKHHTSRQTRSEYNVVFRAAQRRQLRRTAATRARVPRRVPLRSWRANGAFPRRHIRRTRCCARNGSPASIGIVTKIAKRQRPILSGRQAARVEKLRDILIDGRQPWLTVRDAIERLARSREVSAQWRSPIIVFNPGARSYPGHTGSPLDEPAKTLKAGDHGVPGGENMLARVDGSVRYFTAREAARLQTFPDDYTFRGPWTEAMRQLGNAVPVRLAETVARSVASTLLSIRGHE